MKRGVRLNLAPLIRVQRALYSAATDTVIQYKLKSGQNGGFDPYADNCASVWNRGKKTLFTSDCIGFALWCYGWDRFQPSFPFWGGWMNTNAIVAAAKAESPWVDELISPEPGCLVVYPSNKLRGRLWGHIGVYVGNNRVAHCHGPQLSGPAISVDPIEKFTKVSGCIFVNLQAP